MLGTEALGKVIQEDEAEIYPLEFPNPKGQGTKAMGTTTTDQQEPLFSCQS